MIKGRICESGEIFLTGSCKGRNSKQVEQKGDTAEHCNVDKQGKDICCGKQGCEPFYDQAKQGMDILAEVVLSVISFSHNSHTDVVRADIQGIEKHKPCIT